MKRWGGSGISWTICKLFAPHSRHIIIPAPHHSIFYRPDALPVAIPTVSKHWRQHNLHRWLLLNFLPFLIPNTWVTYWIFPTTDWLYVDCPAPDQTSKCKNNNNHHVFIFLMKNDIHLQSTHSWYSFTSTWYQSLNQPKQSQQLPYPSYKATYK